MLEINTEILLTSDFVAANKDEEYVFNGSLTGRIVDISSDQAQYFITFDDTEEDDEGDVGFWIDVDCVELA